MIFITRIERGITWGRRFIESRIEFTERVGDPAALNIGSPGYAYRLEGGDFPGFHPHCHIILTGGCFYGNKGMFRVTPPLELKKLEAIFRHKVFKMLLKKGNITEEMVRMLLIWRHSGFQVFCGYSNTSEVYKVCFHNPSPDRGLFGPITHLVA